VNGAPQPVPPNTVYLSFSAEINQATTESLLHTCANLANAKVPNVYLLLSTPGGSVQNGITLYNTLKSLPFHLTTHNMGGVDSIGNVVFLAGKDRYCCSNAAFMFHGVGFDVTNPMRFEEKSLQERLDSVLADQKKIATIIADRTNLTPEEIGKLFLQAVTKDAAYAKSHGIIHEIRDVEIPAGAPVQQFIFQR
jgi:ATP-dependent Clp protease protease subunit